MKKFNLKKIAMMGLAAMMAVSAMSVSVFAEENDGEYGTVESLAAFSNAPDSYTINPDGSIDLNYSNSVISPLGVTSPPTGANTRIYLYGSGTSGASNLYINTDTSFTFSFSSSCTTSTAQYAEFLVGATSTTQKVYFEGTGANSSSVNISMVPISTGYSTLGPKTLSIKSSDYDSVYFKGFQNGALYAVKITPKTAGVALSGTIHVSNTDF